MSRPLPAAALAVIDHAAMAAAAETYDAVHRLHQRAAEAAHDADLALSACRKSIEQLVTRTAAGDMPSDGEIDAAFAAERNAVDRASFHATAKVRTAQALQTAQLAYAAAEAEAKSQMVTWAINHRIAAARNLDEAKAPLADYEARRQAAQLRFHVVLQGIRQPDKPSQNDPEMTALNAEYAAICAQITEAEAAGAAAFDEAFAVLHSRGALRGGMPSWPSTEAAERTFWGVPAEEPEPELEAAA